jgi:energy-coupling factor transporter ATP-binding protein EcfA2
VIQIDAIHIEEFRGIRELDLQLGSKSFVVWGPNGSGKSGVVDAIDFVLTGRIARLSGTGTGGVSVLRHGPHVYQRDNAESAKVVLTIRDTASGQSGVLTRTVKTAHTFILSPDTAELRAAVALAQDHPELTLSRREIIRYVLAEPGKRQQEVQALLKLERVDQIRRLLVAARKKSSAEFDLSTEEVRTAEAVMRRHLDLFTTTELLGPEVTTAINKRRAVLGLVPLDTIAIDTDLRADISDDGPAFNKSAALRDIRALTTGITEPATLKAATGQLLAALDELTADPDILASLRHHGLVETGISLVDGPSCPLCDLPWPDVQALKAHLQAKLDRSAVATALESQILTAAAAIRAELGSFIGLIQTVCPLAVIDGEGELASRLRVWGADLTSVANSLTTVDAAAAQRQRITTDILATPADVADGLAALQATITAKPDQTATSDAKTFLIVAQERWTRVRLARARRAKASTAQIAAQTIYDTYCTVADEALANLYKTVEDDFSAYYRQINADDESSFRAALEQSGGKLGLSVDFYGIGMYPPAAYHSEGHQDGMGVCLYLALIKRLLGDDFRLAVLDDVVMSVDRNHRRQFCALLKNTFPDVQFIVTTHDEVWARQMQSSGLIGRKSQARFHGWTVDGGPVCDLSGDIWDRIDTDLANDDIPGAAHKIRRYLEAATADLAESLGARVTYRADANYDLGELLTAVKGRHGDLLKKAAASADSWNNTHARQRVQDIKDQRIKVIPAQECEGWAINKLVNNNDWATMGRGDFAPILDTSRQLLELFTCGNADCGSWIYVVGPPGKEDSLRCNCGSYNLNLRCK